MILEKKTAKGLRYPRVGSRVSRHAEPQSETNRRQPDSAWAESPVSSPRCVGYGLSCE